MIFGLPDLEMARVSALGADQKKSELWGRDCDCLPFYSTTHAHADWLTRLTFLSPWEFHGFDLERVFV